MVGSLVGIGVGRLATWVVNQINLDYSGLYPLLVLAFGFLSIGLAAVLGGSGFLAVYTAGIVLGGSSLVFRRGIFSFHDAIAWLGQIALFVMLGLLSFPSRLLAEAAQGLVIALVLIAVARPLAVVVSALPFRFRRTELALLSWVGLKGAVPITLATFPLMAGVPHSQLIFNAVFFGVLISAISQGWSLPQVARWLRRGNQRAASRQRRDRGLHSAHHCRHRWYPPARSGAARRGGGDPGAAGPRADHSPGFHFH